MRKSMISVVSAVILAISGIAFAGGGARAPLSTSELKQTIGAHGKATLVFFLNPKGGPCQEQQGILDKLLRDRQGNFNIAKVSALIQDDQKAFYDYGIRSLPALVLVDKSGGIARVFPPGIQTEATLNAALDRVK